jgi:benzoyl-CoA-dihydrodiol lyase
VHNTANKEKAMQAAIAPEQDAGVDYRTSPEHYRHWKLAFNGTLATLSMDVAEDGGLRPGYKLKLNSYDLGVDIELHDALQRIRFEHPEVKAVVITSAKERMFCSGANIYMLGLSSHAWKVNFCKFTNETRNGIEDSSRHSGLKFLAALNGITAGGGYELALACDEILMIDDRSSAVSLPEVPLLGVLPGTGGLTRITDKRRVRRDHADMFCTITEGVRAERAREWRLVDTIAKPQQFEAAVAARAAALAAASDRPQNESGVVLPPIERSVDTDGMHYRHVEVKFDHSARTASVFVSGPQGPQPADIAGILALGAAWWPLAMARELDDAILCLRGNELELGVWLLHTRGDVRAMLAMDRTLEQLAAHWFVRETVGMLRRTFARLETSSRSLFAVIDTGSCFAGTLCELALAADRSYMLSLPDADVDDESAAPRMALSNLNFGAYPTPAGVSRIAARFYGEPAPLERARVASGHLLDAEAAVEHGLVTLAPDDLDWNDEIRVAIEERASLSPDALTGLEANLRFNTAETMETRIFGRLSAWQNWIFNRPNATGETGALKVFGTGNKVRFNRERV